MWPVVFSATQRTLLQDETAELVRLAELVQRGIPGRGGFNVQAVALYSSVFSSGILDATHDPTLLESLLQKIDELRSELQ